MVRRRKTSKARVRAIAHTIVEKLRHDPEALGLIMELAEMFASRSPIRRRHVHSG